MTNREKLEVKLLVALAARDMRHWKSHFGIENSRDMTPALPNSKLTTDDAPVQRLPGMGFVMLRDAEEQT
jgi:hypothetical protein